MQERKETMKRDNRPFRRMRGIRVPAVCPLEEHTTVRMRFIPVVLVVLFGSMAARAVIIRRGDGSGNGDAPQHDPGWANVGSRGVGSAVYLRNGWVITCAHVGAGSVTFGDTEYDAVDDSAVRLHDPNNPNLPVDIVMFQIDSEPEGMRDLSISRSAPSRGTDVIGIGYGRNREEESTWWNSCWQQETGSPRYRGFEYDDGRTKRWGENDIDATGFTVNAGYGSTYALRMDFDRYGGQGDEEFQAADGDSGGGLFAYNGSEWELCGLMMAVGVYGNQPDDTAVYGNYTYAVDLSRYYDQLTTVIATPEPAGLVLLASGGLLLLVRRQRRKTK